MSQRGMGRYEGEQSSVVRALAQVLKTVLGNDRVVCHDDISLGATIRICSYRDDFEFLWNTTGDDGDDLPGFLRESHNGSKIIVVWDAIPGGSGATIADLRQYITPLDWAVWVSLTLSDCDGESGPPSQRVFPDIFVLDIGSDQIIDSHSVQFFRSYPNQSPQSMPWVQVFPPVPCSSNRRSFGDLVVALSSSASLPVRDYHTTRGFSMVKRFWQAAFLKPTESSDHHAIANVVGSSLFLGDSSSDPRVSALQKLLRCLELLPRSSPRSRVPATDRNWIDWSNEQWADKITRIRRVDKRAFNMLLVDDAAIQHRWGEIVSRALGLEYIPPHSNRETPYLTARGQLNDLDTQLYVTESADDFLQSINTVTQTADETIFSKRFLLSCTCTNSSGRSTCEPIDLIFLDLRLFQGKSLSREARFFRRVINLAKSFCEDASEEREHFPWPGFRVDWIHEIEAWVARAEQDDRKTSRDDTEYFRCLTLLPRLISLFDLSVPLILFSSTDRRHIVEELRPYRNILTSFAKPRLQLGQDTRVATELAQRFGAALAPALEMVAARRFCAKIVTKPNRIPWEEYRAILPAPATNGRWRTHLMLDEAEDTKSRRLSVGGLLAIYPPGEDPQALSDTVFREFPQMMIPGGKDYVRHEATLIVRKLLDLCIPKGILLIPISLSGGWDACVCSALNGSNELQDECVGDNLHRQIMRCVIELSIYCITRQLLGDDVSVEVSVMAGTRVKPPLGDLSETLWERWGTATEDIGPERDLWIAQEALGRINRRKGQRYPKGITDAIDSFLTAFNRCSAQLPGRTQWIRHFGWGDVRPLVEEIMTGHLYSSFQPSTGILRAYILDPKHSPDIDRIHAVHLLADAWISTAEHGTSFEALKRFAIVGRYDRSFVTLLESCRLIGQVLLPQGLAHAATYVLQDQPSDTASLAPLQELQLAAQALTGPQFLLLSQLLASSMRLSKRGARYGRICEKGKAFAVVLAEGGERYLADRPECPDFQNMKYGDRVTFSVRRHGGPGASKLRATAVRICRGEDL